MSRQTYLAYLPEESRANEVLSIAATLARQREAHLIGTYVLPPITVYPMVGELPQAVYDGHTEIHRATATAMKQRFDEATTGDRFVAEWRTIDALVSPVAQALMPHVRSADMVIAPYYSSDEDSPYGQVAETLAMEGGRPVLMIPQYTRTDVIGEHITIAWDDSREATRAVFDAMDLLQNARSVRLLSVGPAPREGSNTAMPGAEMAATLARRGIRCEIDHLTPDGRSIGDVILGRVGDMGSDLLVMGIYGHSKLREFVFGGVTRHVLRNMTVPVLVSR